jgi:hypothetical protein
MSLEEKVQYVLDRWEIQDKIALYGLGQDLHQSGAENKNILEQWNDLFTPDATIDVTSLDVGKFGLHEYAELMRGKGLQGGGLEAMYDAWQHLEGHATVTIDGDTATSLALHLHTHQAKDGARNLVDAGYWHDKWVRTDKGWRIKERVHQSLYTNTFPVVKGPPFLRD